MFSFLIFTSAKDSKIFKKLHFCIEFLERVLRIYTKIDYIPKSTLSQKPMFRMYVYLFVKEYHWYNAFQESWRGVIYQFIAETPTSQRLMLFLKDSASVADKE